MNWETKSVARRVASLRGIPRRIKSLVFMTSFLSALNCPTTLTSYFKCQLLAITVHRKTREAPDPERLPSMQLFPKRNGSFGSHQTCRYAGNSP
jgi:hypothetical protein